MAHAQTVADLESKNKRLLAEIDKVQTHNFELQNENKDLKEILTNQKHSEQLAAWAIDRALEVFKQQRTDNLAFKAEDVIGVAEKFCAWVHASSAQEKQADRGKMQ